LSLQLVSKISDLCGPDPPTLQTDGQTDGQTTCDRNTALCTIVHRAVKMNDLGYLTSKSVFGTGNGQLHAPTPDNCHLDNCPPDKCPPGQLSPRTTAIPHDVDNKQHKPVFFTAQCILVQSAVLRIEIAYVVRLSVCLSVTYVYGSGAHTGRLEIYRKLIARAIGPTPSLFVAQKPPT